MMNDNYWDEDGRCKFCGAGDDAHHSYTCETGLHPDRYKGIVRSRRIKGLESETADLRSENAALRKRVKELEALCKKVADDMDSCRGVGGQYHINMFLYDRLRAAGGE